MATLPDVLDAIRVARDLAREIPTDVAGDLPRVIGALDDAEAFTFAAIGRTVEEQKVQTKPRPARPAPIDDVPVEEGTSADVATAP